MEFLSKLNKAIQILLTSNTPNTTSGKDVELYSNYMSDVLYIDNGRLNKYKDYSEMDDVYGGEISSVLDAVADSVLRQDTLYTDMFKIKANLPFITKLIKDKIYYLGLAEKLWPITRSLTKYGDCFVEIVWAGGNRPTEIEKLVPLSANSIYINILNGEIDKAFPYKQVIDGQEVTRFRPWQIVHFKVMREPTDKYGTSYLKSARLLFKQLRLMEDKLVMDRINKSAFRLHKIDITGKTFEQGQRTIEDYKKQFSTKLWVNPSQVYARHQTPIKLNDEVYMGVTEKSKNIGIELVESKTEIDITDIEYIREKMLSTLKVPKHRLNIDIKESGKATTQDQTLFFAATLQRIQQALISGFTFMFDLQLLVKDVNINDRKNAYSIVFPEQRTNDELIAARVNLIRSTVAKNYMEMGLLPIEVILRDILMLDTEKVEEIKKIMKNKLESQELVDLDKEKEDKEKKSGFNKTGTGSSPIRLNRKEEIEKNKQISEMISHTLELIRDIKVCDNPKFKDLGYIKDQLKEYTKGGE